MIKHEVQALDPDQPVASISTMEGNIATSLAARRLIMTFSDFRGSRAFLASVGLYGVMALTVTHARANSGFAWRLVPPGAMFSVSC